MKEINKIKLAKISGDMKSREKADKKDIEEWKEELDAILEDEMSVTN